MNISGLPSLITLRCADAGQANLVIIATQPISELLAGDNTLSPADIDAMLVTCDGNGQVNGTFDSVAQTPLAPPSPAGQAAITSLVGKGWTVTTDPWQFTFADGGGGFWDLVVDPLGNVGTTAGVAPATADVILADGFGGFWKVAVDVTGLRYTIADPGPATAAPVLFDGEGGFWQLVVDALGNLGATLVYHYPVYWEPYTEIITWTDTNGVQTGNLVDFTATVDLATLTDFTATALAITELIFDGTQLPALTTITCPNNAALTNLQVPNCTSLITLDCNTCAITSLDLSTCTAVQVVNCLLNSINSLNVTGCTSLIDLGCDNNQLASITGLLTCTALTTIDFSTNLFVTIDFTGLAINSMVGSFNPNLLSVTGTGSIVRIDHLELNSCAVLNDVTFPNWSSTPGTDLVSIESNPSLTSLSFPSLTWDDSFTMCIFINNALDQVSVDGLLASFVASGVTTLDIELNGGTNAQPTDCTDVNTLRGLGNTVIVNGPC